MWWWCWEEVERRAGNVDGELDLDVEVWRANQEARDLWGRVLAVRKLLKLF